MLDFVISSIIAPNGSLTGGLKENPKNASTTREYSDRSDGREARTGISKKSYNSFLLIF